jgi:hypothetical protein
LTSADLFILAAEVTSRKMPRLLARALALVDLEVKNLLPLLGKRYLYDSTRAREVRLGDDDDDDG